MSTLLEPPEELSNVIVDIPIPEPVSNIIHVESTISETWSKWDIALYVGAPLALGLAGLWFYRRRRSAKAKDKEDKQTKDPISEALPASKSKQPLKLDEPSGRQELAQAAKTKGNRFFKDGKYEDAITCYTEAIKTCPPDIKADMSTFYQNRAAAYESLRKYENVVEDCKLALELNPKYSKALARRSKAYEVLEKYRDSLEDITKACLLEGFQNQTYLQAADRVLKTLGKARATADFKTKKPISPSKFFVENYLSGFVNDPVRLKFVSKKLNDLAKMGIKVKDSQGEEAEPVVEDQIGDNGAVLLEKPSSFERAKNCLSTHDYDQIIPLCNEELEPLDGKQQSLHRAEALLLRGTMKQLQGQGYEAEKDFTEICHMEAVDSRVKSTALLREACLIMQRQGDESAMSKFILAKEIDPDNSDLYHHHGQQLLQLENTDEAITQFDKSISLSPDFPTSYVQKYYAIHRKAIVKEDLSLLRRAQEGFEDTIKKFPTCGDALILYAQALSDQTKFDEADKHFQKAHKVQPENASNVVHRGLMLLQWKGDVEKTLELLDEALKIDPSCQYAYEIRGTIEVQRGRLPEAMECFNKAIAMSTSEAEMSHLYSLKEAAEIQVKVAKDLNLQLPTGMMA